MIFEKALQKIVEFLNKTLNDIQRTNKSIDNGDKLKSSNYHDYIIK